MKAILIALVLVTPSAALAQEGLGWSFHQRFQGSSNSSGLILKSDSSAGYTFNRFLNAYVGVPVYLVRDSVPNADLIGGLGNAYLGGGLSLNGSTASYVSNLVLTAPTGNRDHGFSIGKVTLDWSNSLSRSFGSVTPFVSAGLANTISDTSFFVRPFSSSGLVTHYEGGALWGFSPLVGAGASFYGVRASGEQRVVSRTVQRQTASGTRVFERVVQTVLPAETANDHGFSGWFSVTPQSAMDFQIGYSRSVPYALDTIFFGVGFRAGPGAR